jgi:F-type H+-transporting ATPase subunit delta
MRDKKVAERYALAALASITDKKEMEQVGADLGNFAELYAGSADLRKMCAHPAISKEDKAKALSAISKKASYSAQTVKVLNTILKRGRIVLIADIAEGFTLLLDEKLGRQKVSVVSAFELDEKEISDLEKSFSTITGKKAVVEVSVDKSIIGGLVARAGSVVYDGSISNQLKRIKHKAEV